MNDGVLVAYASRAGATAGVAEVIGKTLAENAAPVEVRRMIEVTDLCAHRAVVAGSAVHRGQWLPEAMHFMQTQRMAWAQELFAAFLVCMTLSMRNADQYREHVATWLAPGALETNKVPSFADRSKFRLSVAMGVRSEGDHRDWNARRGWAESVQALLLLKVLRPTDRRRGARGPAGCFQASAPVRQETGMATQGRPGQRKARPPHVCLETLRQESSASCTPISAPPAPEFWLRQA